MKKLLGRYPITTVALLLEVYKHCRDNLQLVIHYPPQLCSYCVAYLVHAVLIRCNQFWSQLNYSYTYQPNYSCNNYSFIFCCRISDLRILSSILKCLAELIDLSFTAPCEKDDPIKTFFSFPHHCSFSNLEIVVPSLSHWPVSIIAISEFINIHCHARVPPPHPDCSLVNTSIPTVQWSYTESKIEKVCLLVVNLSFNSLLSLHDIFLFYICFKILIGRLLSNKDGGISLIGDDKVAVPLLLDMLPHIGSYIVATKVKLVRELAITDAAPCKLFSDIPYIVPLAWKTISPSIKAHATMSTCLFFFIRSKNKPAKDQVTGNMISEVHVCISPDIDSLSNSSGTSCILRIYAVDRYYEYLQYGCLYSFVSSSDHFLSFPTAVINVMENHIIEFLEESGKWDSLPVMDISELVGTSVDYAKNW